MVLPENPTNFFCFFFLILQISMGSDQLTKFMKIWNNGPHS